MMHPKLTPTTTIIAFDLHGVISTVNYVAVAKLALHNPTCMAKLTLYSFNPWFLRAVYKLWHSHAVAASYLELVKNNYPFLMSCIPFLIEVGNAQKPNVPLISFIKELKARGYSIHLFSNIGDIIMDDFARKYPEVVQLFDALHITNKNNGYVGKPYDAAFISYQTQCNPTHKQVIFIDNTQRNINAAQRHDMLGIYYTTTSSLIKTLKELIKL